MDHNQISDRLNRPGIAAKPRSARFSWGRTLVFLAAIATLTASAQHGQPADLTLPLTNRYLDANDLMELRQQAEAQKQFESINALRRKRLAEESAALIKLSVDLRAEMDKTDKDTLNLNVVRKADQIEKIAHDMKETMKLTVGQG